MKGFTFNGKHNYNDFGLIIESKSIQSPSKKKIKIDVPFMNGSYDFSTVGSNGEITYNQRSITVILGLSTKNKEQLYLLYSKVLEWLVDASQSQLTFDDIKDYYFIAEVENIPTFEEMIKFGKLTVTFTAEPFKTSVDFVGTDIWDIFNFEEDIVQDVEFNVVSTSTVNIYNYGRLTTPLINCSANMSIIIAEKTYSLTVGDNKLYGLKLQNGYNSIIINGTGNIEFKFKKVIL